jgi:hypothetical protein
MTTTQTETTQRVLDKANPDNLPDALRKVEVGKMSAVVKATFTGLTDVAAQDITTAAAKAAATIAGIDLDTLENLPPIGQILSLRTTAGTMATHGGHIVVDVGGTALVPQADSPGVATISDDGATLTFQAGVTAFVIQYIPRSAVDVSTDVFAPST